MNRGLFDSRARAERPRADLKQTLAESMAQRKRDLADYPLKGHPIHRFNQRGQFSRSHLILVGDAAGVDPMVGEGISFALGYGPVAAAAISDAFARQDFGFSDYRQRLLADPLLKELPHRVSLARLIYGLNQRWQIGLVWRLSKLIIHIFNRLTPHSVSFEPPRFVKR